MFSYHLPRLSHFFKKASQMADAVGESVQVRLGATGASGADAEFGAAGKTISFPGFLRAYVEGSDDPDAELEELVADWTREQQAEEVALKLQQVDHSNVDQVRILKYNSFQSC
jgi:DNA topoisomerase-1